MNRGLKLLLLLAALAPLAANAAECARAEREAYLDAVRRDIVASWNVPYTHKPINCTMLIKQDFRGEVEHVGIGRCGEDKALLLSVVNAGYRASPMPKPDNPACFSRDLIVTLRYQPITD